MAGRKERSHVTLADVAQLAGVGKATVSRVLNGATRVSPQTLVRINKVIQELNYQPSQAARSLKGDGSKLIGLVMPSISDPFFASSAEAVQRVAHSRGYFVMICSTDYDSRVELHHIQSLIRHRVEGIVLAPGDTSNAQRKTLIEKFRVPVVAFNHPVYENAVSSVVADNRSSSREATNHLLQHGCRKILCLGGDIRLYSISERRQGYRDAMEAAGLPVDLANEANDYGAIKSELKRRLERRSLDAIFAVRNRITGWAFQALRKDGWKIPKDVAMIGFDDFDAAPLIKPAISVVGQPIDRMASQAASLLFDRMEKGGAKWAAQMIELKTELIVRKSCGCT